MKSTRQPKPPEHLSDIAKRFWRSTVAEFELEADKLLVLEVVCVQYDRLSEARALLAKEGIVLAGKRHPAADVEKTAVSMFLRGLRALGLDVDPPGDIGRPGGR